MVEYIDPDFGYANGAVAWIQMRMQKDISGEQDGITQRIFNMDMYLGFKSEIIDITRIS
jgi:hypothetical protein